MRGLRQWFLLPAAILAGLTFFGPQTAEAGRWRVAPRYHAYYLPYRPHYHAYYAYPRYYYAAPVVVRAPYVGVPRVQVLVPGPGVHVRVGGIVDVRVGPIY